MTNAEKAAAIGGGARPSYCDDSICEWPCGCYEDQSGYHLCSGHPAPNISAGAAGTVPPETP